MALSEFFAKQDAELGGPRRAMAKALTPEQQKAADQAKEIEPIAQRATQIVLEKFKVEMEAAITAGVEKAVEIALNKITATGSGFIKVECKGGAIAISPDESKLKTTMLSNLSASASLDGDVKCNESGGGAKVTGTVTINFS